MSVPRPYVTYPFHPPSSTSNKYQLIYIWNNLKESAIGTISVTILRTISNELMPLLRNFFPGDLMGQLTSDNVS